MDSRKVILVVVQRERFSFTQVSLDSILADKSYPFQLVYIDCKSPSNVQQYLQYQANKYQFTLIRCEHYLHSNEARNLALPLTQTADYVVFMDNDVIVHPGWLKQLIDCAEEEQAAIVNPLILQGNPQSPDVEIHVAGIEAELSEQKINKRWLKKHYILANKKYSSIPEKLCRRAVDEVELHCLLVRRSLLEKMTIDNNIKLLIDHTCLSLQATELGAKMFLEPNSVVTFLMPKLVSGFDQDDLQFYRFKWSEKCIRETITYAKRKWNLAKNDEFMWHTWKWAIAYRHVPITWVTLGKMPKVILRFCQSRWCLSQLRTPIESLVYKSLFPPSGIASNLNMTVNYSSPGSQEVRERLPLIKT